MSELAKGLFIAADLFEASPRRNFTREEVVQLLRALPDEIEHTQEQIQAFQRLKDDLESGRVKPC